MRSRRRLPNMNSVGAIGLRCIACSTRIDKLLIPQRKSTGPRSGSSGALPRRRHLSRTVRASHPAYGSSHSFSTVVSTGPTGGAFRSATVGKVRVPRRGEGVGRSTDLHVSPYRNRRCAEEPLASGGSSDWWHMPASQSVTGDTSLVDRIR